MRTLRGQIKKSTESIIYRVLERKPKITFFLRNNI